MSVELDSKPAPTTVGEIPEIPPPSEPASPDVRPTANSTLDDGRGTAAASMSVANATGPIEQPILSNGKMDADDAILAKMGYKQELYRGFSSFMSFSFCFTAVSVLSSLAVLYGYGLATGGPAVMVWGWIISSFFTILAGMALAEICSSYPSAGSVYHWAGLLAPPGWGPFLSYVTGWFNFLGNAAGDASFAYGFASVIAAGHDILVENEEDMFSNGAVVGIAIALLIVWMFLAAMKIDQQGWVNNFAIFWKLTAIVVIIVCVSVQASNAAVTQSASFVFTEFVNETGFESVGYVCLLGLLTSLFTFSGYEAGAHMAEETKGASTAAPSGIVKTCVTVALAGLAVILGMLFNTDSVENALGSTNAFVYVLFTNAPVAAGKGLTAIVAINIFFAGISSMTVTSRIGFAMARDKALPGSARLAKIFDKTKSPLNMILAITIFEIILLLIALGSALAFAAITSITVIGYQISYAIPILLRVTAARKTFPKSDYNLGRFSEPVAWVGGLWLASTSLIFFWPTANPVDQDTMNYTCVVVGGVAIIGGVYWMVSARHWFKGPLRSEHDAPDRVTNN
jgi:amino acid transporter